MNLVDRTYLALVELKDFYARRRAEHKAKEPKSVTFLSDTPSGRVDFVTGDEELAANLGEPLESVNKACQELVDQGRLRIFNTDRIRPNQNGHQYVLIEKLNESEALKRVRFGIKHAVKFDCSKGRKFLDWDVYRALGTLVDIQEVNRICYGLVLVGILKLDTAQWFNPTENGYTYEIVKDLDDQYVTVAS